MSVIDKFMRATSSDKPTAEKFLDASNGNLHMALQSYRRHMYKKNPFMARFPYPGSQIRSNGNSSANPTVGNVNCDPSSGLPHVKFQEAVNEALSRLKWLLVDVHNPHSPDCHAFSQKVWTNPLIASLVKANFVFAQIDANLQEGLDYRKTYISNELGTHFALLNPFTHERRAHWNNLKEPEEVYQALSKVLEDLPTPMPAVNSNGINRPSNQCAYTSDDASSQRCGAFDGVPTSSGVFPTEKSISSLKRRLSDDADDVTEEGFRSAKRRAMDIDLELCSLTLDSNAFDCGNSASERVVTSVENEKPVKLGVKITEPLTELPPVLDFGSAFRVALRFPSGERTVLDLVANLTLQSLFSYFEYHGFPASEYELVHVHPRLRLNDLPPTTSIEEIGLDKCDTLYLQYI